MPKYPFSRWRETLSHHFSSGSQRSRQAGGRNLAFESLERRELLAVTSLADFSVSSDTGEKPQSKVWEYQDQWYAVMPDNSGTWVWKLNGNQWQHELLISNNDANADVKVVGNLAHILLFEGTQSHLATVEYAANNHYQMWSLRPSLVNVSLSSGVETATLEVDSTGRMWIASDASTTMEVRYADLSTQYTNWSSPITVASGTKTDDISTIIAMPNGTIGVMWSNQNSDRFGFRLHVDGTSPTAWTNDEVPASQSALNKGGGMADDHLHLVVASNGTLYAAVKTSYDSSGYPRIALLVRRPSGVWDNLYQVDSVGTRPIVMLNELAGKLIVAYTQADGGGNIYFKESSMNTISFGSRQTLISGSVNNVSATKSTFTDEVVAIAAGGSKAKGAMFRFDGPIVSPPPPQNQAPTVSAGVTQTIQLPAGANLDGTVIDDGLPTGGTLTTSWTKVSGPGTVTFGNASLIDTTATFSAAGTYVLRLTASDGSLSSSNTVTIVVQAPATPPENQPPSVDAGPNRSVVLGSPASLDGTVNDDGLPASPGSVTTTWSKVSGPGTVVFGNSSAVDTTATFSAAGTYVLRLTAFDGLLSAFDEMTVTVASNTAPISIAFQDGLFPTVNYNGTRDTKLNGKSTGTNYATATTLDLDGSPDISDLLYWDISAIPAGSVIESVTLQFNVTNTSSHAYPIYVMQRAWDEFTATWNQASNGNPWAAAGAQGTGDHGTQAVATITATNKGLMQITLNAAGVAAVQAWVNDPSSNRGLIIQDYSNSNGADINSREASTAADRPKLMVTYRAVDGGPIGNPPPTNQAPVVNAGNDQTIQLPNAASLSATVTDDGLPNSPGTLTRTWSRVSGPGTVTFSNATSNNTTASFSTAGTYVLRLTASDGSLQGSDDVTITVLAAAPVNQPPQVNAGADQTIQLPSSASLSATVSDDGLPNGTLTRTWTKVSGPGTVTFGNASSNSTSASFSTAGTYVLRLTASDGSLQGSDDVTITVQAAAAVNQAPVVNAGNDQTIQLPNTAALAATVTDDGLPISPGTVTRTWSRVSGPGTVTFSNGSSNNTTASFSAAGTYVLRLTASDGQLQGSDDITITVLAAPINQPPIITMSSSLQIQLPSLANLSATVTDVGGPLPTPTLLWTVVSGPGATTFANATSANTTAQFSTAGTYVLRLTANDGQLSTFADVTVTVDPEPTESVSDKLYNLRRNARR